MTRAEEPPGLSRNGQDVRRRKRGLLPPEVVELLGPPLRVGTWAGQYEIAYYSFHYA